jgi:hypothetical protein
VDTEILSNGFSQGSRDALSALSVGSCCPPS